MKPRTLQELHELAVALADKPKGARVLRVMMRRGVFVDLKLTEAEHRMLSAEAEKNGVSMCEMIRRGR